MDIEYVGAICHDEQFHLTFDVIISEERKNVSFVMRKEEVQRILDEDEPIPTGGKEISTQIGTFF